MLTIESRGASAFLEMLVLYQQGLHPTTADISAVLGQNAFYMDYYCRWNGVTSEKVINALNNFSRLEWQPDHPVLAGMVRGWRFALDHLDELHSNLATFKAIDANAVIAHTARFLPEGTPLDACVHFTVDGFNGGFQFQDGIGLSILHYNRKEALLQTIAHELHHLGFGYWAQHDPTRQAVLSEQSGRQVAVRHIQNLLLEGMANFYCSPMVIDRETMGPALIRKLEQFQRDDHALLTQAADVFAQAMTPDADYEACKRAGEALMIDWEGIQPAGHYIGQRMIEIMSEVHEQEAIVACVQSLPAFLPLYNQAACQVGAPLFDAPSIDRFCHIWGAGRS